ncbi:MAG: hypothetical protein HYY16_07950 [Planctomycetes bacterium]|nr:hypothetical protein [Planctomycetota bacterium]
MRYAIASAAAFAMLSCRTVPQDADPGQPIGAYVLDVARPETVTASALESPIYTRLGQESVDGRTKLYKTFQESGNPVAVFDDLVEIEFSCAPSFGGRVESTRKHWNNTVEKRVTYPPAIRLVVRNRSSESIRIDGRSMLYRSPDGKVQNLIREELVDKSDQFLDIYLPARAKLDSRFMAVDWIRQCSGEWQLQKGLDAVHPGEFFCVSFAADTPAGRRAYELRLLRR